METFFVLITIVTFACGIESLLEDEFGVAGVLVAVLAAVAFLVIVWRQSRVRRSRR